MDFCSTYQPVPTLHCQNSTKYKVPNQPEDKYVHCTKEQEELVDMNNNNFERCDE